jgi:hypothetical protein
MFIIKENNILAEWLVNNFRIEKFRNFEKLNLRNLVLPAIKRLIYENIKHNCTV